MAKFDESTKKTRKSTWRNSFENKTVEVIAATHSTIQNTQNRSPECVIYDTSLHKTLEHLKWSNIFIKLLENPDGDLSWKNRKPVILLGGTKLQIDDTEYDFNANIEQTVSNTIPDLDSPSTDDSIIFNDSLQTVDYEKYKPRGEAAKSRRIQNIKQILPPRKCKHESWK